MLKNIALWSVSTELKTENIYTTQFSKNPSHCIIKKFVIKDMGIRFEVPMSSFSLRYILRSSYRNCVFT